MHKAQQLPWSLPLLDGIEYGFGVMLDAHRVRYCPPIGYWRKRPNKKLLVRAFLAGGFSRSGKRH